MKKKILLALLAVLVVCAMVLTIAACETTDKHECGHVCPECHKCLDPDCDDPACEDKCEGHGGPNQGDPDCDHESVLLNICQNPDCQKEFTAEEIMNALYDLPTGSTNTYLKGQDSTWKLTGIVKTIDSAYSEDYHNITVTILVAGKTVQCFRMVGDEAANVVAGAQITVTGSLMCYNSTREFNSGCTLTAISFPSYTITVNVSNGTVKTSTDGDMPKTAQAGQSISFKVTANSEYKVESVKVNGATAHADQDVYTLVVTGDMTIDVTIVEASAPETVVLATFEFGNDDSSKTNEGSQDGTGITDSTGTYTEQSGSYTLTLTNPSKVYQGSYDAQGHGCLKLGTSSAGGSFTFEVPANITKVVIYVAGYKSNATSVSYNDGSAISVDGRSANGTYDAIEIDTTNVRSIIFTSTARCKVNTIEFWGLAA